MQAILTLPARDPEIQDFVEERLDAARLRSRFGGYSPFGHLSATIGIPGTGIAVAALKLGACTLVDGGVGLGLFCLANVTEWWMHKYALHRRLSKLLRITAFGKEIRITAFDVLDDEHRGMHHYIFRWEDMVVRERPEQRYAEWQFVLIPAPGVLGVVLVAAGASAALGLACGAHFGWLALLVFSGYVLTYELLHLAYHSRWVEAPQGRLTGYAAQALRFLREHHARHHEPRLQQEYNMNVTVPLADLLFGSFAPKRLLAKIRSLRKPRPTTTLN